MPESPRYACVFVPYFAAAALVRRDPDLRGRQVAVLTGAAATRQVVDVTPEAWAAGIRSGMSATEAKTWAPSLLGLDRDLDAERAATAALLDAAWTESPRVEVAGPDRVCLDLAGLPSVAAEALREDSGARDGTPSARGVAASAGLRLGERLGATLHALGLPVRVAIAETRATAALIARDPVGSGRSVPGSRPAHDLPRVVPPGAERRSLAPLPVALLAPPPDVAVALERWGIATLGELAALPAPALFMRLGVAGVRLQAEARGEDRQPFVAAVPPEDWMEALALDWEVESVESLAFVLHRQVSRLAARLAVRGRGATALALTLRLADGGAHVHRLGGLAPVHEPRTLGRLLLMGLERQALPAPVVGLALEAETAPLDRLQADLFALARPSPRELGEVLGRLAALVGPDRVGAPVVTDSHRPDAIATAPYLARGFAEAAASGSPASPEVSSALWRGSDPRLRPLTEAVLGRRRLVPPLPAEVETRAGRPIAVVAHGVVGGRVLVAAGPWRSAGEWWADTGWACEEWDVALSDGAVYCLARDLATGGWTLDTVYD